MKTFYPRFPRRPPRSLTLWGAFVDFALIRSSRLTCCALKLYKTSLGTGMLAFIALHLSGGVPAAVAETLRVTIPFYSAATEPYFQKMASEFKQKNPGVDIKIEVVNWDSLLQKLTTDIAANANADISIIGTRWIVDFQKTGVVEPLDSYMDQSFRDRFIQSLFDYAKIDNKVYGLPIAASARALYYNKALFTKAGMPDGPKTWDDVEQASQKIKALGNYGFGLQGKEIETDTYWYYALWSFGGDIVKDCKAVFDSDAGVKALSEYKKLIDDGLTQPGVTSYSREDVQNLFKQGRVSMVITAPFLINQLKAEAPNIDYGITAIPSGGQTISMGVTDTIVIFKNSKVKPTAWKFLDYLFTKEPRVAFTKGEGFLPTTKAESEDPYFTQNEKLQQFIKLLPQAKFVPLVSNYDAMSDIVIRALQNVYLDKAKPADALKQAAQEASAVICK
jgi:multiple sugar transport system substrate-binding protein